MLSVEDIINMSKTRKFKDISNKPIEYMEDITIDKTLKFL